jgi:hypothetical protein
MYIRVHHNNVAERPPWHCRYSVGVRWVDIPPLTYTLLLFIRYGGADSLNSAVRPIASELFKTAQKSSTLPGHQAFLPFPQSHINIRREHEIRGKQLNYILANSSFSE